MAKINPLLGKGTGKVGAFLLQVNSGVQILKEKPVKVANPNTDAQVEQRAKLKLMSQLAADMSQAIAFQKNGLVSPRNQFISANIGKVTYTEGKAEIVLQNIELTPGSFLIGIPDFGEQGAVKLNLAAPANVNAVVYALFDVHDGFRLNFAEMKIVSVAGEGRTFPTTLENVKGNQVCYVYGVMGSGSAGQVDYEDYEVENGQLNAALELVRRIVVKGGTLTKTSAALHSA